MFGIFVDVVDLLDDVVDLLDDVVDVGLQVQHPVVPVQVREQATA